MKLRKLARRCFWLGHRWDRVPYTASRYRCWRCGERKGEQ